MKKMNINIANPCHENWDAMTDSDKGRFCASCQKTVVDFTNMSDREIIEFFSKSKDSVCGRLTDEQLSKDLVMPPKPIPWVKYFFRITFPAFIMSLKSCIIPNNDSKQNIAKSSLPKLQEDQNTYVIGAILEEKEKIPKVKYTTPTVKGFTGFVTTEIKHVSTKCTRTLLGDVEIVPDTAIIQNNKTIPMKDSSKNDKVTIKPIPLIDSTHVPSAIGEKEKDYANLDTVFVRCNSIQRLGGATGTSIMVEVKSISLIKKVVDTLNVFSATPKILLFPNPIAPNSRLNIKLTKMRQSDYLLSLMNMSGIILQNQEVKIDAETNVINMELRTITTGTYIVRMVDRSNGRSITQKLIVL